MSAAQVLDGGRALQILSTVRASALLFSVPYVWSWTQNLGTGQRWAAVALHACTVLAVSCQVTMVDAERGLRPHLAATTDPDGVDGTLARPLSWVFAGAAVLAGLALLSVSPLVPLAVAAVLVGAWFAARLPTERRYLGVPETVLPLFVVVLPAVALRLTTPAAPDWWTVVVGASFLAAVVIAAHIRDRATDLRDRVPTLATRDLSAARGWLLVATTAGVVAAVAPLDTPLSTVEWLRGLTALTFGIAAVIRRRRVSSLVAAHGLWALTLFMD